MLAILLSAAKTVLPDWPEWAVDVLIIMTLLLLVVGGLCQLYNPEDQVKAAVAVAAADNDKNKDNKQDEQLLLLEKFHVFRRQYMMVYGVIMLADWMQGTHMYTLYLSYGVNISALFLTGFLSGALFAPFLGSFVDKFGRKRSCIVYCVLEVIINVLEHYDNFTVLLLGRVLGGISTNLLFSSFESWMTTQHRHLGFPEDWLSMVYSQCSIVNGSTAILAGIVAQVLEDRLGHIGPFQGAVALTILALVLIRNWPENYGEEHVGDHSRSSILHQFTEGWKTTVSDSHVWRIGLIQALSEGAMYTFVFMWVPTLLSLSPPGGVPTGCVFSSLMMAITMGGLVYPPLQALVTKIIAASTASSSNTTTTTTTTTSVKDNHPHHDTSAEVCASFVYLLASLSMSIPVLCLTNPTTSLLNSSHCQNIILISFLVMEFCVGLFMPVAGTLRSRYVPDALQGAILNIFRLPLNAIVVSGTYATDHLERSICYKLVSGCLFAAALLQATMIVPSTSKATTSVVTTTTTKKKAE